MTDPHLNCRSYVSNAGFDEEAASTQFGLALILQRCRIMLATALLSTALFAGMTGLAIAAEQEITEEAVIAAQQKWGESLVAIATAYDEEGAEKAREVAVAAIEDLYNYDNGPVLFKPTLAGYPDRFRLTEDSAISYFVGGSSDIPADDGFALKGWRKVDIDNAAIFTDGDVGISMGDVTLTDKNGNSVSVDKTWGFKQLENGNVVIILHHSSIPYYPALPYKKD